MIPGGPRVTCVDPAGKGGKKNRALSWPSLGENQPMLEDREPQPGLEVGDWVQPRTITMGIPSSQARSSKSTGAFRKFQPIRSAIPTDPLASSNGTGCSSASTLLCSSRPPAECIPKSKSGAHVGRRRQPRSQTTGRPSESAAKVPLQSDGP
jgi:hypothetical protein